MKKRALAIVIAICIVAAVFPATALAADVADNPVGNTLDELAAEDFMYQNDGTINVLLGELLANAGLVKENNGTINHNESTVESNTQDILYNEPSGIIKENAGLVQDNDGVIDVNIGGVLSNFALIKENSGDVTVNTGTIQKNSGIVELNTGAVENVTGGTVICNLGTAATVTGGSAEYELPHKVTVNAADWTCNTFGGYSVILLDNDIYVMDGESFIIRSEKTGYVYESIDISPADAATVEKCEEGYLISDVKESFTLTAGAAEFIPVTAITGVPSIITVGAEADLSFSAEILPYSLCREIEWSIVDAGDTNAVVDSSSLIVLAENEGLFTVRATVKDGLAEGVDYTQDFDIYAGYNAYDIAFAINALHDAFEAKDIDMLSQAAEYAAIVFPSLDYMSNEDEQLLADALGVTVTELYSTVFPAARTEWSQASMILSIKDGYTNFEEDPNKETAAVFAELYETLVLSQNGDFSDEDIAAIKAFYPDLDEMYQLALFIIEADGEGEEEKEKEEDKDIVPTGDESNIVIPTTISVACASTLILCLIRFLAKRKKTN